MSATVAPQGEIGSRDNPRLVADKVKQEHTGFSHHTHHRVRRQHQRRARVSAANSLGKARLARHKPDLQNFTTGWYLFRPRAHTGGRGCRDSICQVLSIVPLYRTGSHTAAHKRRTIRVFLSSTRSMRSCWLAVVGGASICKHDIQVPTKQAISRGIVTQ